MPAAAEEVMVGRDIALARDTGARIHFLHLSTAGSVAMVRWAKSEGLPVTAEAAPHHFTLTDGCTAGYDPVFKVNPPLRPAADVEAVKAGLADGTIDAIATDHAPHPPSSRTSPSIRRRRGCSVCRRPYPWPWVRPGYPWPRCWPCSAGSRRPSPGSTPHEAVGRVVRSCPGRAAHLVVIDPTAQWTVDVGALASRSRNCPYAGWTLTGQVRHTLFAGEPVVVDAEAQR